MYTCMITQQMVNWYCRDTKAKSNTPSFLTTTLELKFQPDPANPDDLVLELPEKKPPYEIPVVELVLEYQ